MIHIIFVFYYPDYFKSSLHALERFVKKFACDYHIFAVNNNANSNICYGNNKITILNGSNKLGEFSGWCEGLAHAQQASTVDKYIFANDTFNNHRDWTPALSSTFTNCFKNVFSSLKPAFGGEINKIDNEFSILKINSSSWISTYLFALNSKAINSIKSEIKLTSNQLLRLQNCNSTNEVYEAMQHSSELINHIERWLSPHSGGDGWYGANIINEEKKLRKVKSITCEKCLSAIAANSGVEIIPLQLNNNFKTLHKVQTILGLRA